jgi:transcriptional regulator of arginine metabolism
MRPLKLVQNKAARHAAIRRLIRSQRVSTQEELVGLLAGEGFHVTQATLSRDLAQLGALRATRPDGTYYELDPAAVPVSGEHLRELGDLVRSISDNDMLVVVRTQAGAASAIALAIDTARLPECLGTLAGDDTIFATPVRGVTTRRLAQRLRALFGRELT